MDIIRKHGLWIVAGVIVIFAIGFYFTVVRKLAKERVEKVRTLETRRDALKTHAAKPDAIPGPKWVPAAIAHAEDLTGQIESCAQYLAEQPRNCHTRWFFEDERAGMGEEIREPIVWESHLDRHVFELQKQLEAAKLYGWVPSVPAPWRGSLPMDAEIQEAQETYWFVKDLADALTGQVERDFEDFLAMAPGVKGGVFQKPADLVIDRKLSSDRRLDELMRFVPREKLLAVLEAILINEGQLDLPTIFDTYLSSDDDQMNFSWDRVLGLTRDDQQRQFLEELVPAGNDLANRQRFVDYVMELRTVRYRSDVIGLLENHDDGNNDLSHVAAGVKSVSPDGRARLIKEMQEDWNQTRIAQTIATIVSVYDEKDYKLLRDNHNPQIIALLSASISRPEVLEAVTATRGRGAGAMGGGMGAGGAGGGMMRGQGGVSGINTPYFRTTGFALDVIIELEDLPVLLRRLLSNSWYYSLVVNSIEPSDGTGGGGMGGSSRAVGSGGRPSAMGGARGTTRGTSTAARTDSAVSVRNYVTVSITGEGYQFTPLRKSLQSDSPKESESGAKPKRSEPSSGRSVRPGRPTSNGRP